LPSAGHSTKYRSPMRTSPSCTAVKCRPPSRRAGGIVSVDDHRVRLCIGKVKATGSAGRLLGHGNLPAISFSR
jgi:hypothetical protein